jgi:hypothetical protein
VAGPSQIPMKLREEAILRGTPAMEDVILFWPFRANF